MTGLAGLAGRRLPFDTNLSYVKVALLSITAEAVERGSVRIGMV
jgi:hypothetical protein